MRILSFKPGHDGCAAFIDDGHLVYSIEAEKDSFERYGEISAPLVAQAAAMAPGIPDVVAVGGWHKFLPGHHSRVGLFAVFGGLLSVRSCVWVWGWGGWAGGVWLR